MRRHSFQRMHCKAPFESAQSTIFVSSEVACLLRRSFDISFCSALKPGGESAPHIDQDQTHAFETWPSNRPGPPVRVDTHASREGFLAQWMRLFM